MVPESVINRPKVLTTGQIARICSVAPRTVSKWFDLGQLRGYRIPGGRDRRVPVDQLIRFMKAHGMPMDTLDPGPRRILLIQPDAELARLIGQRLERTGFQVQTAESAFDAGLLAERVRPHVIVLDLAGGSHEAMSVATILRREPHLRDIRLVALTRQDGDGEPAILGRRGVDAELAWPFNIQQLIDVINELLLDRPAARQSS